MTSTSPRRHKLGAWIFPGGNHVDVYLESGDRNGQRSATCEWASAPPLSVEDEWHYLAVVLPALTRRAQEYLERPGRAMGLFA